ncbi:DUF732 domain-containing protein [Mycolicibacterium confluentis]|uniref:DUF732 domain-containing protein n=1 Tax=Mycolicibacterium confluentis TaxID=28047 RepID=A0A7I7XV09_9MYCO|nr:DUF732 domain-containing protein [Mycolicibacterium confluentis]MCV7320866.1 DUF732 domain-containing protein [Mycolicibacterium confluentis]ORV27087.1 hypothetical protein AWB99_20205 [Mycolicibacterium confluentis]BBZ32732.1 hypothetical protein MCNF_13370 [Mycolicibacterium confluentis]
MKAASIAFAAVAVALGLAAPAQADPDTDFTNALHIYGIYGQKDYNAWIGKIACKRLARGVDADAFASAEFVLDQLDKGSTTEQAWQFLGLAIPTYCPDKQYVLQQAAGQPVAPPADVSGPVLPAERG